MRPFVLVVLLLLALVVMVNGLATWDRARHEARIARAAAAFQPGLALLGYRDTDERRFQKARLAVIPRPRIVAFGSSRVMAVSTPMVGAAPGEFYNAGLSGGSPEDFIVLWTTLRDRDKAPEAAIFAIDNWTFNRSHPQVRWLAWADEVARFVDTQDGSPAWGGSWVPLVLYRWYQVKDLLSFSVFRSSLRDLDRLLAGRPARGAEIVQSLGTELIDARDVDGHRALLADGSLRYETSYERRGPNEVRADAIDLAVRLRGGLGAFAWDADRVRRLGSLWRDMRKHGVRIVAYLPPYHPVTWDLLRRDDGAMAGLVETRVALEALAAGAGASVFDLSNPASVPCGEDEFLDGNHARASCMTRILSRIGTRSP